MTNDSMKRTLAIAIVGLALASPTSAELLRDEFGTLVPPQAYENLPTLAPVNVRIASAKAVSDMCASATGPTKLAWGCTQLVRGDSCNIYIRSDISYENYLSILNHEMAHCKGWDGAHSEFAWWDVPAGKRQITTSSITLDQLLVGRDWIADMFATEFLPDP